MLLLRPYGPMGIHARAMPASSTAHRRRCRPRLPPPEWLSRSLRLPQLVQAASMGSITDTDPCGRQAAGHKHKEGQESPHQIHV